MVICPERGADLHIAQLMPLPLTVSCFSKIQIGFTFPVPAHPGSPGQRAIKRVCVCVCVCTTHTRRCTLAYEHTTETGRPFSTASTAGTSCSISKCSWCLRAATRSSRGQASSSDAVLSRTSPSSAVSSRRISCITAAHNTTTALLCVS